MSNEMEKLTINLGVVELAQIDVLVEQGIYSNRSDLIRTAIRKQLEVHADKIERVVAPHVTQKQSAGIWSVGINYVNRSILEETFEANGREKIKISVVGMLKISSDVSAELFENTVARATIRGKLLAPPEIKALIENMR